MEKFRIDCDSDSESNGIEVESKSQMIGAIVEMLLEAFERPDNREVNICVIKGSDHDEA
jgi:hypothetical protein